MSAAHTPGPWRAVLLDPPSIESASDTIADLPMWQAEYRAERDANAHLLAAAPEMADLLTQMLDPLVDTASWTAKVIDLLDRAGCGR